MWMSMTGFGRADSHGDEVSVTADVRSVNHRYLDVHVRCPAKFLSWEARIRALVRDALKRGKVDLFLNVKEWGRGGTAVHVNRALLSSFLSEATRIREENGLAADVTFRDLMGVPDLFVFAAEGADPTEVHWPHADQAVREALAMLQASRREEGGRMREVIRQAVAGLQPLVEEIAALSLENKAAAAARFRERIEEATKEIGLDPARLHQEAAYLLDRLDITEECDRLRSHMAGLQALLAGPEGAVGKRFDFLVLEVFREINTAANKSAHAGISERAVTAKNELEKIREQIQNVE
jgi:uncharacterized protein (TIGR00255 family)